LKGGSLSELALYKGNVKLQKMLMKSRSEAMGQTMGKRPILVPTQVFSSGDTKGGGVLKSGKIIAARRVKTTHQTKCGERGRYLPGWRRQPGTVDTKGLAKPTTHRKLEEG